MWQDFFSIIIITIAMCLTIVALTQYLEARKALNDTTNPWAINTQCAVQDANAMNCLHPVIFKGTISGSAYTNCTGTARVNAPYTAEEVFSEIGQINYSAIPGSNNAATTGGRTDPSPTVWVSKDLGPCTTPGPKYSGCFKTTQMKATLYTRAGQYPLYSPNIPEATRRELINQYGFGHSFKATSASAPS